MKKLILLFCLFLMGCAGKQGTYIVVHKPTDKTYYLTVAPLHHKDGPIMGLPGQYDGNYYHFRYGPNNEHLIQLRRSETKVIGPDGSVEDLGQYLP